MLTPEWISAFQENDVIFEGSGRNIAFYYKGELVPACTPDDPWAIAEVVQNGVPEHIVLLVSKFCIELESA